MTNSTGAALARNDALWPDNLETLENIAKRLRHALDEPVHMKARANVQEIIDEIENRIRQEEAAS